MEQPGYMPTIEEKVEGHLEDGTDTLHICPDAWALRHRFVHRETGEVRRARCDRWTCLYCGPRKVDMWRQVIAEAQPVLHIVLTKAGRTMEEASRALTTWKQAIRRGSKGRGRGHVGARPAYPIETLAVSEEHANFDENGFHWHLLVKGVDYIPHEHIQACWRSATKGRAWMVRVTKITNARAIGYVTKYLTKDITREKKGYKPVMREGIVIRVNERGQVVEDREQVEALIESKARRIRYSRGFFPETTKAIRARLFSRSEENGDATEEVEEVTTEENGTLWPELKEAPVDAAGTEASESQEEPGVQASEWKLQEVAEFTRDVQVYRQRRRKALEEAIRERDGTGKYVSRRVLTLWEYQRGQLRLAG